MEDNRPKQKADERKKKPLENDVVIFLFAENIRSLGLFFFDCGARNLRRSPVLFLLLGGLLSCREDLGVGSCGVSLLLVGHLLQTVEFFSVELIEFGGDVLGSG